MLAQLVEVLGVMCIWESIDPNPAMGGWKMISYGFSFSVPGECWIATFEIGYGQISIPNTSHPSRKVAKAGAPRKTLIIKIDFLFSFMFVYKLNLRKSS